MTRALLPTQSQTQGGPDVGGSSPKVGHYLRLPPHYVTPYRRRNRTDRADCEAILEAALRIFSAHGFRGATSNCTRFTPTSNPPKTPPQQKPPRPGG